MLECPGLRPGAAPSVRVWCMGDPNLGCQRGDEPIHEHKVMPNNIQQWLRTLKHRKDIQIMSSRAIRPPADNLQQRPTPTSAFTKFTNAYPKFLEVPSHGARTKSTKLLPIMDSICLIKLSPVNCRGKRRKMNVVGAADMVLRGGRCGRRGGATVATKRPAQSMRGPRAPRRSALLLHRDVREQGCGSARNSTGLGLHTRRGTARDCILGPFRSSFRSGAVRVPLTCPVMCDEGVKDRSPENSTRPVHSGHTPTAKYGKPCVSTCSGSVACQGQALRRAHEDHKTGAETMFVEKCGSVFWGTSVRPVLWKLKRGCLQDKAQTRSASSQAWQTSAEFGPNLVKFGPNLLDSEPSLADSGNRFVEVGRIRYMCPSWAEVDRVRPKLFETGSNLADSKSS